MEQAISSDLIRGHIDTIILHSLMDGDKFAQQISDFIEAKSNGEYKIIQATLYSSLKRLESLKYVTSYWFDAQDSNGRRKFFKITDLGKETVKNNLNNWSYSRALIDKLVDCTPQPIYQTKVVEKIVEVPVEKIINAPIQDEKTSLLRSQPELDVKQLDMFTKSSTKNKDDIKQAEKSNQEINFRNILNGLIRATQPKKQEKQTELEPVVKTETSQDKLKFNETITAVDYNAHKANNNGKIDFGDLVIKAAQEGYKIRISSKDSGVSNGKILTNKLNMFSSIFTYFILVLEFLLVYLISNSIINFSALSITLILLLAAIFPILSVILFLFNPNKRSNKLIYTDSILTSSIIVFNLVLITFAGNLIFGTDLTDLYSLLVYLLLPSILFIDVLIFYIIKFFIAKSKIINFDKNQVQKKQR